MKGQTNLLLCCALSLLVSSFVPSALARMVVSSNTNVAVKGEIAFEWNASAVTTAYLDGILSSSPTGTSSGALFTDYDLVTGLQTYFMPNSDTTVYRLGDEECLSRSPTVAEQLLYGVVRPVLMAAFGSSTGLTTTDSVRCRNVECSSFMCQGDNCVALSSSAGASIKSVTYLYRRSGITALTGDSRMASLRQVIIVLADSQGGMPQTVTLEIASISTAVGSGESEIECDGETASKGMRSQSELPSNPLLSINKITTRAEKRGFAVQESIAMPYIHDDFRAVIEATVMDERSAMEALISHQTSIVIEESFSATAGVAMVLLKGNALDAAGRRADRTLMIDSLSQTVYNQVERYIPSGAVSKVSDTIHAYFFPSGTTCEKNVFGYSVMAANARSLLLKGSFDAWYMGSATVRGQETEYWQMVNGTRTVQWYFSVSEINATVFTTFTRQLLRIVVDDEEATLVPHHPFYQQGSAFPQEYAPSVCEALFPGVATCRDGRFPTSRTVVYDIYGHAPLPSGFSVSIPTLCTQSRNVNTFPPPQSCSSQGVTTAGAVVIALACIVVGMCLGALISYLKLKPHLLTAAADSARAAANKIRNDL